MRYLKLLTLALLPPLLLQAQSWSLKRTAFVTAGGRVASGRYTAVATAGIPTLSGMESASFSVGPVTAVELAEGQRPEEFALLQNYPNPFNQSTTLSWQLPQAGEVRIALYTLRGEEAALLYAGRQQAGVYRLAWAGQDGRGRPLPSGVYFLRFTSGPHRQVIKLTLVR